jgi:hypothetical protein
VSLLTHKIVGASHLRHGDAGVHEAKLLLKDWLVYLLASYNTSVLGWPSRGGDDRIDATFERHGHLALLPRHIYGLLTSDVLWSDDGAGRAVNLDRRCFLRSLFCRIPPAQLMKALYPVLLSYELRKNDAGAAADPETPRFSVVATKKRHYLTRSALTTSGHPVFVLDALTRVYVFCAKEYADQQAPFPPPRGSALRQDVAHRRNQCAMAPPLTFIDGASPSPAGAETFDAYFIEDAPAGTAGVLGHSSGSVGFGRFAALLVEEVQRVIEEKECY